VTPYRTGGRDSLRGGPSSSRGASAGTGGSLLSPEERERLVQTLLGRRHDAAATVAGEAGRGDEASLSRLWGLGPRPGRPPHGSGDQHPGDKGGASSGLTTAHPDAEATPAAGEASPPPRRGSPSPAAARPAWRSPQSPSPRGGGATGRGAPVRRSPSSPRPGQSRSRSPQRRGRPGQPACLPASPLPAPSPAGRAAGSPAAEPAGAPPPRPFPTTDGAARARSPPTSRLPRPASRPKLRPRRSGRDHSLPRGGPPAGSTPGQAKTVASPAAIARARRAASVRAASRIRSERQRGLRQRSDAASRRAKAKAFEQEVQAEALRLAAGRQRRQSVAASRAASRIAAAGAPAGAERDGDLRVSDLSDREVVTARAGRRDRGRSSVERGTQPRDGAAAAVAVAVAAESAAASGIVGVAAVGGSAAAEGGGISVAEARRRAGRRIAAGRRRIAEQEAEAERRRTAARRAGFARRDARLAAFRAARSEGGDGSGGGGSIGGGGSTGGGAGAAGMTAGVQGGGRAGGGAARERSDASGGPVTSPSVSPPPPPVAAAGAAYAPTDWTSPSPESPPPPFAGTPGDATLHEALLRRRPGRSDDSPSPWRQPTAADSVGSPRPGRATPGGLARGPHDASGGRSQEGYVSAAADDSSFACAEAEANRADRTDAGVSMIKAMPAMTSLPGKVAPGRQAAETASALGAPEPSAARPPLAGDSGFSSSHRLEGESKWQQASDPWDTPGHGAADASWSAASSGARGSRSLEAFLDGSFSDGEPSSSRIG